MHYYEHTFRAKIIKVDEYCFKIYEYVISRGLRWSGGAWQAIFSSGSSAKPEFYEQPLCFGSYEEAHIWLDMNGYEVDE